MQEYSNSSQMNMILDRPCYFSDESLGDQETEQQPKVLVCAPSAGNSVTGLDSDISLSKVGGGFQEAPRLHSDRSRWMRKEELTIHHAQRKLHGEPKGHRQVTNSCLHSVIESARTTGTREQTYLKPTAGTLDSRLGKIALISDMRGSPSQLIYCCQNRTKYSP